MSDLTREKIIDAMKAKFHTSEGSDFPGEVADALGFPAPREMGEFERELIKMILGESITESKLVNFAKDRVWQGAARLRAALARDEEAKHE